MYFTSLNLPQVDEKYLPKIEGKNALITDEQLKKFPRLREDIKISKMVQHNRVNYVVKDPLKGEFFRFNQEEWSVIALFDGAKTKKEMVDFYNEHHPFDQIGEETIDDYLSSLESMNLLKKGQVETNIMLVEKMKEMRQSQLLSKKGSLMYKRFPLVDPDKFFNSVIPKLTFFWTKGFFIASASCMAMAIYIILINWNQFNLGLFDLFSFSTMSFGNFVALWLVIYTTIAIHELGHGLTCKYYGGEVHEIGFLLLFFQPCLYANVNDAWLFDKKWKQVMVTLAGGYIEFFIGSIFTFIWALTNPNTFVNILSFQVMAICSVSTVLFNFNPLVKLDGYYLFSDFVEIPNLKENSGNYIKYLVSKYIFRMTPDEQEEEEFSVATPREKRILFFYGIASSFWVFGLLTGLVGMAFGMLVGKFHEFGILMTGFVAYKLFYGQFKSGGTFLVKWYMKYREKFKEPKIKKILVASALSLLLLVLFPFHYTINGQCTLEPEFIRIIRTKSSGTIKNFVKHDGEKIRPGDIVAFMNNPDVLTQREIASLAVQKLHAKIRKDLTEEAANFKYLKKQLITKELELQDKQEKADFLAISYNATEHAPINAVLSCQNEVAKINTNLKEGDEVCKALGVEKLKTIIKVSEQQVRFLNEGNEVKFKLSSLPLESFSGVVTKIRQTSESDPINPKNKLYLAELLLDNTGNLRPGMKGFAKIYADKMGLLKIWILKLSMALRMDLFY